MKMMSILCEYLFSVKILMELLSKCALLSIICIRNEWLNTFQPIKILNKCFDCLFMLKSLMMDEK